MSLPLILPASPQNPDNVPAIKPQIPTANRNTEQRVFLEKADTMRKQTVDSFLVLIGNVEFSRGGMHMFCDSAHYYPEIESLDCFGNVWMQQGDTLSAKGDSLKYRNDTQLCTIYGTPVTMRNRDVQLQTDEFIYDLYSEFGYYNVGGVLTDKSNRLESVEGEYVPATKEATFYDNVHLTSTEESGAPLHIYTDTLYYNTNTHLAQLFTLSVIIKNGDTIFTTRGDYDTNTGVANLFNRSKVKMERGTTLEGDTLFYDRNAGYGWARGNMEIVDSAKQSTLRGDYGYYDQVIDSSYVTGHAVAMEYSKGDTLYVHGRELFSFRTLDTTHFEADTLTGTAAYERVDTSHVLIAHPRVRFFRTDMQGICDSLRMQQRDSLMYMYRHPIVWSDDRQIFGNVIKIHFNDSTFDRATLPEFGFTAQHVAEDFYNQLSGKEMIAYFEDQEMKRLDVNGNVEAIMLPMENDSTYNKIINLESSYLKALFEKQQIQWMKMWPETGGTVTPLYLSKKSQYYLPKFKWYTGLRPTSPEDIFIIPKEMDELMESGDVK